MTKVTRQRKSTIAAELAAQPAAQAPAEAAAPAAPAQPVAPKAGKVKAAAKKKSDKPAAPAAPATPEVPKAKTKLVRDSFTMPKAEYELLAQLKQRGTVLHRHVKKSELLRAGIAALAALSDEAFLTALDRVPSLKTGRPKAEQAEGADQA
ncbi:hypothetical protein [uncultured Aquincola sp.]|uniref:hypothetical protein n=1 Tax=uncultured Aquincola sp. TaxID=886556 RepID=UPI0032B2C9AF